VHALYTRCEEYKTQVTSLNERIREEQYERKQLKAELENSCQQQLEAQRASRTFHLLF